MSNRITSTVFAKFLIRDIPLRLVNDKCTVTSVVRLDARIYVTVLFICDEREDNRADRHRIIQNSIKRHR